jgi:hypothetical protein
MSVILVCLGIFFLFNYRLFLLLEREDWPALAYYLEQKIFVKNRYNSRLVKLLASSYMVISDYPSVLKLENKTFLAKKSVVEKNVLVFGAARVISGDYKGATAFFKIHLDKSNLRKQDREWVRWFYGFSWLLSGVFDKAENEFLSTAVSSESALITGISAFFLAKNLVNKSLRQQGCLAAAEKGRSRVVEALKKFEGWIKEVKKAETEIHVAIIRKYIDQAGKWLFSVKETASPDKLEITADQVNADIKNVLKASRNNDSSHPIISDKRYIQESSNIKEPE